MNEKKPINLMPLYLVLALTGGALIITGLLLGIIFSAFSINVSKVVLGIFQTIFIISGIADFCLLIYAKKKLS